MKQNKAKFAREAGLPVRPDVPMIGIVSRLTRQKGFDVVVEGLHRASRRCSNRSIAPGDPGFEESLLMVYRVFQTNYPLITFDVKLAQEIYASDIFLMPSQLEP